MKNRGLTIDTSIFDLKLTEPQHFSDYRQIELDGAKAGLFNQLEGTRYLSKRFMLKKYLGLSESEILENEEMYSQENPNKSKGESSEDNMGLADVGIKSNEFDDMGDLDFDNDFEDGVEPPPTGMDPSSGMTNDIGMGLGGGNIE